MLRLLSVLVLVLTFGVGQMWGAMEKITLSSFGWSNASTQSSISSSTATIALAKNTAETTPTYYTADGLRIYGVKNGATTGGTIAFTAKTDITIKEIAFSHTLSNGGYLAIKTGTGSYDSSTKKWSGTLTAGNTVSLVARNASDNNKNPQVKITEIRIQYLAKVTFDANGGSCATANVTQADTASTVSLPTPTRDGFTCTGWYTAKTGGTKRGNAGGSYKPTASETLYAQWESAGCANKVDITKGTPESGASFNLSKTGQQNCCSALTVNVTDITAPSGKRFKAITQSGIAAGNVTINNTAKTVTYAANSNGSSTINVEFEDIPKYTVTLKDDDSELTQATAGASVTLPERSGCTGYTFVGWTKTWTSAQSEWTTTAPDIIEAGNYIPTADEELYPVYTKTESGGSPETVTLYYEPFTGSAHSTGVESTNVAATTNMFVDGSATVWSHYSFDAASTAAYANNYGGETISDGIKIKRDASNTTLTMMEVTGIKISDASDLELSLCNRRSYTTATLKISYKIDDGSYTEVGGDISYNSTNDTWKKSDGLTISGTGNSLDLKIELVVSGTTNRTMVLEDIKITGVTGGSTTSYISVPNCCTELGQINGSFFWTTHFCPVWPEKH